MTPGSKKANPVLRNEKTGVWHLSFIQHNEILVILLPDPDPVVNLMAENRPLRQHLCTILLREKEQQYRPGRYVTGDMSDTCTFFHHMCDRFMRRPAKVVYRLWCFHILYIIGLQKMALQCTCNIWSRCFLGPNFSFFRCFYSQPANTWP